ncbi:hypothetical protein SERLADRAFT_467257 [Serpula lacrymans var. lacrymans S7.9]|uniref:Crinkler effector protein N-terminal domain-containing protein n=1 Tax=Serpula lacrymans var. lacrymans (strain S7.9) TaxID=578457 RepID=F8NVU7_SERL9|nr:uncharacterized protein SERLADRAFT_467257 [Serpula lacrymans var. lacrymans S7.9]EGO24258.1 hypothetical protein SERLADRAFT_467257 [Serpula lacrymans var. lacrymans S7.9]
METLNCWVHGEDVEKIFTVNISSSETVSDLKDVIKNKNSLQFRNLDASGLDLYSICLPDDEQLEGSLSRWDHSEERKLNGRYKLSAISPDSKEGVWFIIVRAPSSYWTITCWIYGSDVESIFNVKISSSETVSNLRDVIKNVNTNKLRNVDASDLDLYSICLPDDEQLEGTLSLWDDSEEKKLTRPLKGLDKISKVFSEPPKEDHLHIIVQNPATAGPNLSPIYQ